MSDTLASRLFHDLLARFSGDITEAYQFQLAHPVLLSAKEITAIYEQVRSGSDPKALELIKTMAGIQKHVAENEYPFGYGPLEQLYQDVKEGRLTIETACQQVIEKRWYHWLSPLYVRGLSNSIEQSAMQGEGWQQNVDFLKLVIASLQGCPAELEDREYEFMWRDAVESWIAVVTMALHEVPDGRLLRQAVAFGEDLLQRMQDAPPQSLWRTYHRLGVLYLDPYFAGRNVTNYTNEYAAWIEKGYSYFRANGSTVPDEDISMPSPEEALETACQYLKKAIEAGTGIDKARSLKAIAEACNTRQLLLKEDWSKELDAYIQEALALFVPAADYPQERIVLMNLIHANAGAADQSDLTEPDSAFLLSTPMADLIARYSSVKLSDLFGQLINFYLQKDIKAAHLLWQKNKELFELYSNELFLKSHYKNGLIILKRLFAREMPEADNTDTVQQLAAADALAITDHWSAEELAATNIAISFLATARDEEEQGLQGLLPVLDELNSYPSLTEFADALQWLKAALYNGAAVNKHNTGDEDAAIGLYGKALDAAVALSLNESLIDILEKILDLCTGVDIAVFADCIVTLSSHALSVELISGLAGRSICQDIYRISFMRLVAGKTEYALLLLLIIQYSKGFAYAATLGGHRLLNLAGDEEMTRLLENIELQQRETVNAPVMAIDGFENDLVLNSFIDGRRAMSGDSSLIALENLQIRFDELVYDKLLRNGGNTESYIQMFAQLDKVLAPDTVLMICYFGSVPSGEGAIYTFLITREEKRLYTGVLQDFPSGRIEMTLDGRKITTSALAYMTYLTRQEIRTETFRGRVVTPEGKQRLEEDSSQFLGGTIKEQLASFYATGKRHLCIIPHGGLHFYPFHLLPVNDKVLADDWIVTYQSNLRLLDPNRTLPEGVDVRTNMMQVGNVSIQFGEDEAPAVAAFANAYKTSRNGIAAMGVSVFEDHTDAALPPLPGAAREAADVAAIFDTPPLLDSEVTKEAFMNTMRNSAMVHIATHGRHNLVAPVFQCIYVQPDAASDGIIYAYEFLEMDLRGLDLVTLSACDTALGRIDDADNMRGLPAALLTAGVATIIGTLWEARDEVCATFFKTFYEQLKGGLKKYEAFYRAQQHTRSLFGEYKDWGAFYLVGERE